MQTLVDLSDLLSGRLPADVYRWPEQMDVVDVEQSVVLAGWNLVPLDSTGVRAKVDALSAVAAALDFPTYFGGNYDALADCLRDLEAPTVLLWDGSADLAEADPGAFEVIVQIFADRTDRTPAFAVLVR